MLFGILTLSAIIKGLQFFIIEILQKRIFVRIVGDLSERLPRLERAAMDGIHGPEMANRFFDVMTIQKSTASLLVEGLSLIIQTLTGLLLLALYSPYLLAFDIVLLIAMTGLLYLLGGNAVRTAIEESLVKYRLAHWLQDVIGNPTAFQVHGGGGLVVDRANRFDGGVPLRSSQSLHHLDASNTLCADALRRFDFIFAFAGRLACFVG